MNDKISLAEKGILGSDGRGPVYKPYCAVTRQGSSASSPTHPKLGDALLWQVTKLQNKLAACKVDLANAIAKIVEEEKLTEKLQASIQTAEADMERFQAAAEDLKGNLAAAVAGEKQAVQAAAEAATHQAASVASGPDQVVQKLQQDLVRAKQEATKLQAAKCKVAERAEQHLTAAAKMQEQLQATEAKKQQLLEAQAEHEQLQVLVDQLAHGELEAATESWKSAQTHYMVLQVRMVSRLAHILSHIFRAVHENSLP